MASGGRPARSGSAEKSSPVPHTRISDESDIEEVYEMSNKLGQGSFGVVREVIHRKSGQRWACKAVNKEKVRTGVGTKSTMKFHDFALAYLMKF